MTHATHCTLQTVRQLLVASIRSSRLIFQAEEKKQVTIFQVNEAVPVMFRGELSWHFANPIRENVEIYLDVSWTTGGICCMKSGLISLSGDYLFNRIICSQPHDRAEGEKKDPLHLKVALYLHKKYLQS